MQHESRIMTTELCPQVVAGDLNFIHKKEWILFKKYKEIYPDWSIQADLSSKKTLYWKAFIMKYKKKLADTYGAKAVCIPGKWDRHSDEEIKEDLNGMYNL